MGQKNPNNHSTDSIRNFSEKNTGPLSYQCKKFLRSVPNAILLFPSEKKAIAELERARGRQQRAKGTGLPDSESPEPEVTRH